MVHHRRKERGSATRRQTTHTICMVTDEIWKADTGHVIQCYSRRSVPVQRWRNQRFCKSPQVVTTTHLEVDSI